MAKGESSREKTRWEIQKFLYAKGSATSKEIYESCTSAKATFYKYLNELYEEGKVKCKPQRGQGKDLYELSEKARSEMEESVSKQELKDKIDKLPVKQIKSLYELIDKLLMKSISLTLDNVMLEKMLHALIEGKISKDKLAEIQKGYAEEKKALFAKRDYFFAQEEIDRMSRLVLTDEESEILGEAMIKWFEKWFGPLSE